MAHLSVNENLKANYADYYEGPSEWRRVSAIDKANNIVSLCQPYAHESVLEIGSGDGAVLSRLSELGFAQRYSALEISQSAVEIIRQRNLRSLIECRLFDGYAIPYSDDQFDLAILSHVLEHLEYPRKMLYEASRVARYVFVEVPLEDNLRLKKDFVFDRLGHLNAYSFKTVRRLIQSCGLEVLTQKVTNPSYTVYRFLYGGKAFLYYLPKEILLRLAPKAALFLWTYHCSLLCQRAKG